MGAFHNLNNTEVLHVYFSNKAMLLKYDEMFKYGSIEEMLVLNENTVINKLNVVDDEDLKQIAESDHYKNCVNVESKLYPIIELIREELPDLYDRVKKSFNNPNL